LSLPVLHAFQKQYTQFNHPKTATTPHFNSTIKQWAFCTNFNAIMKQCAYLSNLISTKLNGVNHSENINKIKIFFLHDPLVSFGTNPAT
jgi:hypothetical protein